jgi:hypothetical protein
VFVPAQVKDVNLTLLTKQPPDAVPKQLPRPPVAVPMQLPNVLTHLTLTQQHHILKQMLAPIAEANALYDPMFGGIDRIEVVPPLHRANYGVTDFRVTLHLMNKNLSWPGLPAASGLRFGSGSGGAGFGMPGRGFGFGAGAGAGAGGGGSGSRTTKTTEAGDGSGGETEVGVSSAGAATTTVRYGRPLLAAPTPAPSIRQNCVVCGLKFYEGVHSRYDFADEDRPYSRPYHVGCLRESKRFLPPPPQ